MEVTVVKQLKSLEDEITRLKMQLAETMLDTDTTPAMCTKVSKTTNGQPDSYVHPLRSGASAQWNEITR